MSHVSPPSHFNSKSPSFNTPQGYSNHSNHHHHHHHQQYGNNFHHHHHATDTDYQVFNGTHMSSKSLVNLASSPPSHRARSPPVDLEVQTAGLKLASPTTMDLRRKMSPGNHQRDESELRPVRSSKSDQSLHKQSHLKTFKGTPV